MLRSPYKDVFRHILKASDNTSHKSLHQLKLVTSSHVKRHTSQHFKTHTRMIITDTTTHGCFQIWFTYLSALNIRHLKP